MYNKIIEEEYKKAVIYSCKRTEDGRIRKLIQTTYYVEGHINDKNPKT